MIDLLYSLVQPLLFGLDAETAHGLVINHVGSRPWLAPRQEIPKSLSRDLGGLHLPGPVGLAAGMDKEGIALLLWERLGFGFIELGTVLRFPQEGDDRPRIHRLVAHRALRNHMGFPSTGMDWMHAVLSAHRAAGRWPSIPVGINIGINKNVNHEHAHEDYAIVAGKLGEFADYLTINVSSPNTPGLRALQKAEPLKRILHAVIVNGLIDVGRKPVFVKFSPDMDTEDLVAAVKAAEEAGAAGVIATNTTARRPVEAPSKGGISGPPLFPLAKEKIAIVLETTKLPVIGVGGVDSGVKAAELLDMGCQAVQLYTSLVYEGPGLPRNINDYLAQRPA